MSCSEERAQTQAIFRMVSKNFERKCRAFLLLATALVDLSMRSERIGRWTHGQKPLHVWVGIPCPSLSTLETALLPCLAALESWQVGRAEAMRFGALDQLLQRV